MDNNVDIAKHVTLASNSWACIPFPSEITRVPDAPFKGMSVKTVCNAPAHLLAHIIRTKANKGVQVVSPRAVPMLGTVERIDPAVRQADHIVVTTQASANRSWPTVDGRDLEKLFPKEPNRCKGTDAAQVTRTKTRAIGKSLAATSAGDPVSRAIVRSASVIDMQRRPDVNGDADVLAEVLDVAWTLPLGTFATLAPLVMASSQDLLRTAISSDHNAPDALMSIQRKKVIHVHGGVTSRRSYGADVSIDWARQRATARAIFSLSCALEGMDLLPTMNTWAAANMLAPIHSSMREKHLVFQPAYGSALAVDPVSFRFVKPVEPPKCFSKCLGLHPPNIVVTEEELAFALTTMVDAGLPAVAGRAVMETFRLNKVAKVVIGNPDGPKAKVRGADAAAVHTPSSSALIFANAEITHHLSVKLARGAQPAKVLRSRIYEIMGSIDAVELVPIFRTMTVMKNESGAYNLHPKPFNLLRQMATRLAHSLGNMVAQSMALESERVGQNVDEWLIAVNSIMPKQLVVEDATTVGWAMVAIWSMWAGTTGKWNSALAIASHETMVKMASATMGVRRVTTTLISNDPIMEAAQVALSACKSMYAPYYESMYDYYALLAKNSPNLVPLGVGATTFPFSATSERYEASLAAYAGAGLWQLRGRHLKSAYLKKIELGSPSEVGMERRINCVDYEIAIMVAPNKFYESYRKSVEALLPEGSDSPYITGAKGDVRSIVETLPAPLFPWVADSCDGRFQWTRLGRYVLDPKRWVRDLQKTHDEVASEVAGAAMSVGMQRIGIVESVEARAVVPLSIAAVAPVAVMRPSAPAVPQGPVAVMAISDAFTVVREPELVGTSGWQMTRNVYGEGAADMIMDMEDVATEAQADTLLNSRYTTEEEFIAAVEVLYDDPIAVDNAAAETVAALNM